jgi:hypothetical protein
VKLYVTPGSPYARMARIVVLEKALEQRVEIILAKTRATGSPYYEINPSGRVPYLVRDDGVGMEESALIAPTSINWTASRGSTCRKAGSLAVLKRWREACSTALPSGAASSRGRRMSAHRR